MRSNNHSPSLLHSLGKKLTRSSLQISEGTSSLLVSIEQLVEKKYSVTNVSGKLEVLDANIIRLQKQLDSANTKNTKFRLLTKIADKLVKKSELLTKESFKEEAIFKALVYYGWALNLKPSDSDVVNKHINLTRFFIGENTGGDSRTNPRNTGYVLCYFAFQAMRNKITRYDAAKVYAEAFIEQCKMTNGSSSLNQNDAIIDATFYYLRMLDINMVKLNDSAAKQIKLFTNAIKLKRLIDRGDGFALLIETSKKDETKKEMATKAIISYMEALTLNPNIDQQIEILTKVGNAFLEKTTLLTAISSKIETVNKAMDCYAEALSLNPETEQQAELLLKFGNALVLKIKAMRREVHKPTQEQEAYKAIGYYMEALASNPTDSQRGEIYLGLGNAFILNAQAMKQPSQNPFREQVTSTAISYYMQALALTPNSHQKFELLVKLGNVFAEKSELIDEPSRKSAKEEALFDALNYYGLALLKDHGRSEILSKFSHILKLIIQDNLMHKLYENNDNIALSVIKKFNLISKKETVISITDSSNSTSNQAIVINTKDSRPTFPVGELGVRRSVGATMKDRLIMCYSFLRVQLQPLPTRNQMLLQLLSFWAKTTNTKYVIGQQSQLGKKPAIWVLDETVIADEDQVELVNSNVLK